MAMTPKKPPFRPIILAPALAIMLVLLIWLLGVIDFVAAG